MCKTLHSQTDACHPVIQPLKMLPFRALQALFYSFSPRSNSGQIAETAVWRAIIDLSFASFFSGRRVGIEAVACSGLRAQAYAAVTLASFSVGIAMSSVDSPRQA